MMQFVIAKSLTGEYITKRKGMDYTQLDYEEGPPEKKAKGSQEDDGDISLAISHYEARLSAFKKVIYLHAKMTSMNNNYRLSELLSTMLAIDPTPIIFYLSHWLCSLIYLILVEISWVL